MKTLEVITYTSIIAIVVSLFFIGTELTGFTFANDTGVVNVTIGTSGAISFTSAFLDFGTGTVSPTQVAVIDSEGGNYGAYWTGGGTTGELVLENIGNVNLTLQLQTDKNASDFIGGSANQAFEAKVADGPSDTGACTGTNVFGSGYFTINETLQDVCGTAFRYENNTDEIIIDFNMTIPDDATGTRTIQIKAVGTY